MPETSQDHPADFPAFFEQYHRQISEILRRPLLFVCGAPKSGTTWLQLTLNHHPEIHCAGEGHFTDWLGRPLNDLLATYNTKIARTNGFIYGERAFYRQELKRRDLQFLLRNMIGMALLTLNIKPTARWIGDKTPLYTNNLDFFEIAFPQCRIVNIVRDVRDACVSTYHQSQRLVREGLNDHEFEHPDAVIAPFVRNWLRVLNNTENHARSCPDKILTIRYEDLYDDGPATLARVLAFLDVERGDATINACLKAGSFQQLSKGRQPGEENRDSFFRKGVIGDWRHQFAPYQVALIHEIAGEKLAQYGYDTSLTSLLDDPDTVTAGS